MIILYVKFYPSLDFGKGSSCCCCDRGKTTPTKFVFTCPSYITFFLSNFTQLTPISGFHIWGHCIQNFHRTSFALTLSPSFTLIFDTHGVSIKRIAPIDNRFKNKQSEAKLHWSSSFFHKQSLWWHGIYINIELYGCFMGVSWVV